MGAGGGGRGRWRGVKIVSRPLSIRKGGEELIKSQAAASRLEGFVVQPCGFAAAV